MDYYYEEERDDGGEPGCTCETLCSPFHSPTCPIHGGFTPRKGPAKVKHETVGNSGGYEPYVFLGKSQGEWFRDLVNFYLENGFLSTKQQDVIYSQTGKTYEEFKGVFEDQIANPFAD